MGWNIESIRAEQLEVLQKQFKNASKEEVLEALLTCFVVFSR